MTKIINELIFEAVGAGQHHHNELEEKIYREALIYIDHKESAEKELAGLLNIGLKFAGEIGQLITEEIRPGSADKISIFQSLGK